MWIGNSLSFQIFCLVLIQFLQNFVHTRKQIQRKVFLQKTRLAIRRRLRSCGWPHPAMATKPGAGWVGMLGSVRGEPVAGARFLKRFPVICYYKSQSKSN